MPRLTIGPKLNRLGFYSRRFKLTHYPTLALLAHLPRNEYPLPGIANLWMLVGTALSVVFIGPPEDAMMRVTNGRLTLSTHEWEYGVSCVPGLLIAALSLVSAWRGLHRNRPTTSGAVAVLLLASSLTIPLALNWYGPSWNSFIKGLPVLDNSSNLLRWFSAYIPVAIVMGALAFDSLCAAANAQPWTGWMSATCLVVLSIAQMAIGRSPYYRAQDQYDPTTIDSAWIKAASSGQVPAIMGVGAYVDALGHIIFAGDRNDPLVHGSSDLGCYQPLLGYGLEQFPVKGLTIGPVMQANGGKLNLKNPSCYLYPKENACTPGDPFTAGQRAQAEAFVHYKPFDFARPFWARIAQEVSVFALCMVAICMPVVAIRLRLGRLQK